MYKLSPTLIKLIFAFIVCVIFAIVIVKLFRRSKYYSFETLKSYFSKKSIIRPVSFLICLVYFLLLMTSLMLAPSFASIKVSLNYAEASKGQNMNGTRYNMSEILCDGKSVSGVIIFKVSLALQSLAITIEKSFLAFGYLKKKSEIL